jgi:hypothetical protein
MSITDYPSQRGTSPRKLPDNTIIVKLINEVKWVLDYRLVCLMR